MRSSRDSARHLVEKQVKVCGQELACLCGKNSKDPTYIRLRDIENLMGCSKSTLTMYWHRQKRSFLPENERMPWNQQAEVRWKNRSLFVHKKALPNFLRSKCRAGSSRQIEDVEKIVATLCRKFHLPSQLPSIHRPQQSDWEAFIKGAFKGILDLHRQRVVGKFRIDLLDRGNRLAFEFDECHHGNGKTQRNDLRKKRLLGRHTYKLITFRYDESREAWVNRVLMVLRSRGRLTV